MSPSAAKIVDLYAAGKSLRQVARRVGLSHEGVRAVLIRAGVELRPRSWRAPES